MSSQTAPSRTAAWWSQSKSRSQATAASAIVLTAVLVGISAYVWVSPTGAPLRKAVDQAAVAVTPFAAQNVELKKNLDRATETIASQKGKLTALQKASLAAQAAAAKQLATAQQQAAAAEGKLASVQAQLSAEQAKNASGSSGAGSATHSGTGGGKGGSGSGGASTPITAPSRAALVNPDKRYYGMYTEQAPFNWATFDATAKKVGVAPNMVGYFSGWDENFRANAVTRSWQQGRLPLLTWESRPIGDDNNVVESPAYSLPKIIGGDFDAYLHQYAKDIVATGLPLAIRLDHEMNGNWYPWSESNGNGGTINGNNPGDFVKMWRHVHDIFQQEGANDLVIWDWSPNIVNKLSPSLRSAEYLASLYPGDDYVDWVGVSGYLRPPYSSNQQYTFDYTFTPTLNMLRALTKKPIILSEIGASEIGSHKAAWVTDFFQALGKPENSDVIGFSWFNLAITSYVGGERATNDWRIDSRSDSLSAFIAGITRPEDDFELTPAP